MHPYPEPMTRLIRSLCRLPGIGEKTAERLVMFLLHSSPRDVAELAENISNLKKEIRLCRICFGLSDADVCRICKNPARDKSRVCVVENPADLAAIERSGAFNGCYHVLHGLISPMDGIGPNDLRIRELEERIRRGSVSEVIIATGTSVEGEATADFIKKALAPMKVLVTRIASGVPMGGELKYVDPVTLKKAIEARRA